MSIIDVWVQNMTLSCIKNESIAKNFKLINKFNTFVSKSNIGNIVWLAFKEV